MSPHMEAFSTYQVAEPGSSFTDWLRARSEPHWSAAVDHRFTRELEADAIDDEVYRSYLEQDYLFVEALVNLLGHAISVAPTMEDKSRLSEFLGVITSDENDYFDRAFGALGSNVDDVLDGGEGETTRAFRELFAEAREDGAYVAALAVLVPVEWVYLEWATRAAEHDPLPDRSYLVEWIDLHASVGFRTTVAWLRSRLDELGADLPPERQQRIAALFVRAVELEVAFFGSAYEDGGGA